ncbi:MAG TPA: hypothetical protein PKE23_03060 [Anaerolineales bacterium]|nr:hypothetical protein [Anaerolineales bacterium]
MLSSSDFLHLPYTPDLTEAGIAYALRSLAYSYERDGRSPYGRLRRLVANVAVELAFRRYLTQEHVSFEVKASTPFTDRERFDVVLNGHRCDLKPFLISHREQILQIRKNPAVLLDAQALVPSDSHAGDGHSYNDIYLFAFMNGLVAASQADLQKAIEKNQPHYLVYVPSMLLRKPIHWKPLGTLTLRSESAEELIVEVNGQDEAREMKREVISLSPGVNVKLHEVFYSITSLHVRRVPEARIRIHCEALNETLVIAPHDWSNIWVYGMDIFMVGYATYEEMSQRATLLLPNSRTFQYERTHVKNLSLLVSKLKPIQKLWAAVS